MHSFKRASRDAAFPSVDDPMTPSWKEDREYVIRGRAHLVGQERTRFKEQFLIKWRGCIASANANLYMAKKAGSLITLCLHNKIAFTICSLSTEQRRFVFPWKSNSGFHQWPCRPIRLSPYNMITQRGMIISWQSIISSLVWVLFLTTIYAFGNWGNQLMQIIWLGYRYGLHLEKF